MEKHIGLIGTGLMGYGIGSSLLENGYPLHISTHKNITNVKRLELKGAYVHDSIKEIAEKCNVIILCLPDAHSVEGVILGENGIYNHIKEGSVVLDCTTSDPNTTRLVGQALKNKGVELFDSPLNRGPKEAEEGRLNIIIGGNQSKLNRIMPILESFAENISYVGELGEAHKLKLFNNYISMALTATVISAIAYAKEEELDLNKLDEVMSKGSNYLNSLPAMIRWVQNQQERVLEFSISNALKDLKYFQKMINSNDYQVNILNALIELFEEAEENGIGNKTLPYLSDLFTIKLK